MTASYSNTELVFGSPVIMSMDRPLARETKQLSAQPGTTPSTLVEDPYLSPSHVPTLKRAEPLRRSVQFRQPVAGLQVKTRNPLGILEPIEHFLS